MCVWMADGEFFWLRASESVYKSLKVVRGVYYIDTDPKKHRFFKDYHTQHIVHTGVIDALLGNASPYSGRCHSIFPSKKFSLVHAQFFLLPFFPYIILGDILISSLKKSIDKGILNLSEAFSLIQ